MPVEESADSMSCGEARVRISQMVRAVGEISGASRWDGNWWTFRSGFRGGDGFLGIDEEDGRFSEGWLAMAVEEVLGFTAMASIFVLREETVKP